MNNQLIIEKDFEKNFLNILIENKFKECLVVTSDGNERRGYHDSFIELIEKNKSNFFVHKINKYPNLLEIEKIFKNYGDKNIDLVLSIGGEVLLTLESYFPHAKIREAK